MRGARACAFRVRIAACAGRPRGRGRATVYQPTLGAFLLGLGAGAVGQIAVKFLLPALHLFRRCCNVSGGG